jgi:hypothetical protein
VQVFLFRPQKLLSSQLFDDFTIHTRPFSYEVSHVSISFKRRRKEKVY